MRSESQKDKACLPEVGKKAEKRMVQMTLGSLTLKGSNVLAPGKEVRHNPGIERYHLFQRWLGIFNKRRIYLPAR